MHMHALNKFFNLSERKNGVPLSRSQDAKCNKCRCSCMAGVLVTSVDYGLAGIFGRYSRASEVPKTMKSILFTVINRILISTLNPNGRLLRSIERGYA